MGSCVSNQSERARSRREDLQAPQSNGQQSEKQNLDEAAIEHTETETLRANEFADWKNQSMPTENRSSDSNLGSMVNTPSLTDDKSNANSDPPDSKEDEGIGHSDNEEERQEDLANDDDEQAEDNEETDEQGKGETDEEGKDENEEGNEENDTGHSDESNEGIDGDESEDSSDEVLTNLKDEGIQRDIVMGFVKIKVPSQVQLVRIFTSSTFTDTFVERNTLMERTYPKLKEYCQGLGYDFQVVDMRWGVRDEATDDHMTSELCMRELKACQTLSTGPNFITFLGQKYGYRPFPPNIVATEFEKMLPFVENEDDKSLLLKWFKRDDNVIPPTYILSSIRALLPDYNNKDSTAEQRKKASDEWWSAFERMQVILRTAASKSDQDEASRRKYFISVTEDEISRGILSAHNIKKHCFWFRRNIVDLKERIAKAKARLFIDKGKEGIDSEANVLLTSLSDEKMPKVLPKANVKEYKVEWCGEQGISVDESEDHKSYIDNLCNDFYDTLVKMIDDGIAERKEKELDDPLIREISQHTTTCQEKTRIFRGHEEILEKVASYLDGKATHPLVIHGPSGCGKTSLMAMAAAMAKERHPEAGLILRFLGTTSQSSTIGQALHSVSSQLMRILESGKPVPEQFKKLYEFLGEQLMTIDSRKVFIFLDSLDQLSSEDGAHTMHWLPKQFASCVKIVISTLPDPQYFVFPYLKSRLPDVGVNYIEVPKLPDSTAAAILDAWLSDSKRTLNPFQREKILKTFQKTPLPLFLKLSFDEAIRWKSYTPESDVVLEETIKAAINKLFERIERLHGTVLVSHALGYITAAKNGLSDAEIDDLLSLDDEVLNDVYQYWTPPVRRIPPLLWVRARSDLSSYIVSRGADGVLVNQWYHRQFIETATERYLSKDKAKSLHKAMADYFLGKWSNRQKKPFVTVSGQQDEKDRLVPAQPNIFSKEGAKDTVFNLRRLQELPRHLIRAEELELFKNEVVFNFDFLLTKLRGTNLRSVVEDFNESMEQYAGDRDIKLIRDCVLMSARALYKDPYQLGAQFVARLGDYESNPRIKSLLDQVKDADIPCLYPSVTCFEKPGGPLVHSLAGHTGMITRACLSRDGSLAASVSQDNTVKVWDMKTGSMIKSIDKPSSPQHLLFAGKNKFLVLAGFTGLQLLEISTEEVLFEEEYLVGQYGPAIALSGDEGFLAHSGHEKITVFSIEGREMAKEMSFEHKGIQNENGFYDFISGGGDYYAYSRGDQTKLFVRKFNDRDYKKTISPPRLLLGATFTPDGKELAALTSASKMTEQNKELYLVVWDTRTWDIVQDRKSAYDHMILQVQGLSVANLPSGPELIWPAMFLILFWNLNTGKERITLRSGYQGNQYKEAQVSDGQNMLVTSMDANMHALQVYDLELLEYEEGGNKHLSAMEKAQAYVGKGERELMIAEDGCGFALSIPPADAILTVWDLKRQCRQSKIAFDGCYPSAVHCIDKQHAVLYDYHARKAFLINYEEGIMESVIEGYTCDVATTPYMRTWEHAGDLQFMILDRSQTKINFWDMRTGKLSKTISPGWKEKIGNMWVSRNKSMMVIIKQDHERKLKQVGFLFHDLTKDSKAIYEEKGVYFDLRPEVRFLSSDGKTFLCVTESNEGIRVVDTTSGKSLRTLTYSGEIEDGKIESAMIMCIALSNDSKIAIGSVNTTLSKNNEYTNTYHLVAWDLLTGEVVARIKAAYMSKMIIADDDRRLFTVSQAVNEQAKAAQIWDISQLREGKFMLIGSFLPETDLRFACVTSDGECAVVGIANIEDIVFLRPCGSERIPRSVPTTIMEHKIKPDLKPFEEKK